MSSIGFFGFVGTDGKQVFEGLRRHQPGAPKRGDDFFADPTPDGPERHSGDPGNVGSTEVFRVARHDCFSERGCGGAESLMSGCRALDSWAACRASRRAISISTAEGALSDFLLFERTRAISTQRWRFEQGRP